MVEKLEGLLHIVETAFRMGIDVYLLEFNVVEFT